MNSKTLEFVGFFGANPVLFVVLKLAGFINWSWWMVLSPVWATGIALLCVAAVCMISLMSEGKW